MKTLKIDEKWTVEYDETQNDRPIYITRNGEPGYDCRHWDNVTVAMFYALLAREEAAADTRRLTRELDVAMHGEASAAKQASLCDLIPAAKALRAKALEALIVLNAQGMFAKPSEYGPDEQFMLDEFSMRVSFEEAQTAVRKARDILSEGV